MSTGNEVLTGRGEEEALFSRDEETGQLLRMTAATRADLDLEIKIQVDGQVVRIKKAVPRTDDQGQVVKDEDGLVIPRNTTIYDAVSQLYRDQRGEPNPIPLLCHREYMNPVAVCRVCVVQIAKLRRRTGRIEVSPKLVPACQHLVDDQMIIDTINSPDPDAASRVGNAVRTLTELLMADHPSPCAKQQRSSDCELEDLAAKLGVQQPRFAKTLRTVDRTFSSQVIAVDHDACILCDRCIRGCNEIRENHVIGRMGKGAGTRIAFDLDQPMGASSCVACGECMVSCPTGALTHVGIVDASMPAGQEVDEDTLFSHPIPEIRAAFGGVARPFLRWNARAVARRNFKKGEIICREAEYGSTAFLIESGSVEVFINTPVQHLENRPVASLFGWFTRFRDRLSSPTGSEDEPERAGDQIPTDLLASLPVHRPQATMGPGDLFGEMTCMGHYPRSATVRAAEDCTVLEMLSNVLYIMKRSPSFRRVLDAKYRDRTINNHLRGVAIFAPLRSDPDRFEAFVNQLKQGVKLQRCDPGEVILRQGATAEDGFYLVRTGFVKVSQSRSGGDVVLNYVGPGGYLGEIGLLDGLPELANRGLTGVRTATCQALDHVDLVQIRPPDFHEILRQFPEVRAALVAEAVARLEHDERSLVEASVVPLGDFLDQGLFVAENLLVLDLEKCTRCDECTRACADTHEGVTRLIREGLRYDKFLVASSCRSCLDPYCLVGCPVGSIQRSPKGEIVIKDWCIGCGTCADNCPYGNINMVEVASKAPRPFGDEPNARQAKVRKATTCDLCKSLGPSAEPSCVYACPHDAAHRMSGSRLLQIVQGPASQHG